MRSDHAPDVRVRYFFPSALPRRFAGRMMVIVAEAILVVVATSVVAVLTMGTTYFSASGLGLAVIVTVVCFTLSVPMNEWLRARWLARGLIPDGPH